MTPTRPTLPRARHAATGALLLMMLAAAAVPANSAHGREERTRPATPLPPSTAPQADDDEVPRGPDELPHIGRARPLLDGELDPPAVQARQSHLAPAVTPRVALPGARSGERDPVEDLLVRSQKGVTLGTVVDELLDDLVHALAKEDLRALSPLAVRLIHLSPNLRPSLQQTLEAKLVARLGKLGGLEQVSCVECRAIRSRVEGDDWVVTLGATTQSDLRRIGEDIGVVAFADLDLTFTQVPAELTLAAKIYRATDGRILWTAAYKGDETTAAILRTGKIPPSREEQLAELHRKLEMRPYFGYMMYLGVAYLSSDGPAGGYVGANPGIRLFERFGHERRHMYGFQGEGFLDWAKNHPLFGGMISAGYWFSLLQPNLNRPDLRIGATAGGFIAGTDGNSAIFQVMAEYVLQFRLAINLSAIYMVPTKYGFAGATEDLGGLGGAARFAFSW